MILTFFLHVTVGFLNITLTIDVNGIEDVDSAVLILIRFRNWSPPHFIIMLVTVLKLGRLVPYLIIRDISLS